MQCRQDSAFCNATVQTRVISCGVVAVAEKKSYNLRGESQQRIIIFAE